MYHGITPPSLVHITTAESAAGILEVGLIRTMGSGGGRAATMFSPVSQTDRRAVGGMLHDCGAKGWTFDELGNTCHPWKPIAPWVQKPSDPAMFLTEEELRINEEEKRAARERTKAEAAERRAQRYESVEEYRDIHGQKLREW